MSPFGSLVSKNIKGGSNSLEALSREGFSRVSSITLPQLSSIHSSEFLRLADEESENGSISKRKEGTRFRGGLWGEGSKEFEDPNAASSSSFGNTTETSSSFEALPEWYSIHNPRCLSCLNPLIRGLTTITTNDESVRKTACSNCGTQVPRPIPNQETKKFYPSVRKRRKMEISESSGKGYEQISGSWQKNVGSNAIIDNEMSTIGESNESKNTASMVEVEITNGKEDYLNGNKTQEIKSKLKGKEKEFNTPQVSLSSPALSLEERKKQMKSLQSQRKAEELEAGPSSGSQSVSKSSRIDPSTPNHSSTQSIPSIDLEPQKISELSTSAPSSTTKPASKLDQKTSKTPNNLSSSSLSPSAPSTSQNLPSAASNLNSRRKKPGSNQKSDLKALLMKDKLKKEEDEKEKKKREGGGLRGFLDLL